MSSYNFCPECGKEINRDAINCPNCGEPIIYERFDDSRSFNIQKDIEKLIPPRIAKSKGKKPLVKRLGFLSWILLLTGGIIGLFALSTPAGSIKITNIFSWDMWMFGLNIQFESGVGTEVFWTLNENLVFVSIFSTVFVITGNIAAIISAGSLIKKGVHNTYAALAAPIVLIGAVLFYLAGYQVLMFFGTGESFWSLMNPAFAIYGQFIASPFMILGFLIARSSSKYIEPLEKELHQEKVLNMLKNIVETKLLLEDERNKLKNELEVISLRLKGVTFLKKKFESLNTEQPVNILLEQTTRNNALEIFQQALNLSSEIQQEISKKDLNLVQKIMEQQDDEIVYNYIKEISDHTTVLIGDILKRLTS